MAWLTTDYYFNCISTTTMLHFVVRCMSNMISLMKILTLLKSLSLSLFLYFLLCLLVILPWSICCALSRSHFHLSPSLSSSLPLSLSRSLPLSLSRSLHLSQTQKSWWHEKTQTRDGWHGNLSKIWLFQTLHRISRAVTTQHHKWLEASALPWQPQLTLLMLTSLSNSKTGYILFV